MHTRLLSFYVVYCDPDVVTVVDTAVVWQRSKMLLRLLALLFLSPCVAAQARSDLVCIHLASRINISIMLFLHPWSIFGISCLSISAGFFVDEYHSLALSHWVISVDYTSKCVTQSNHVSNSHWIRSIAQIRSCKLNVVTKSYSSSLPMIAVANSFQVSYCLLVWTPWMILLSFMKSRQDQPRSQLILLCTNSDFRRRRYRTCSWINRFKCVLHWHGNI